jgi:hypothetical protein
MKTLLWRAAAALVLVALAAWRPALAQEAVANPHVRLRGLACTACHATTGWRDVKFDHRRTRLPLRGQHTVVPCSGCHDLRDFHTVAQECRFCHQDPHRGDAGLRCEQCHQESSWRQVNAQYAHARTRLPELGVHAALRCDDCHRQAAIQQFSGAVTPCVTCHRSAFAATTNPSHTSLSFSTQCETCHQFTTWSFALFAQHDAIFGIYSGRHAGVWRDCATCHANPADYKVFSCAACHGQTRMDAVHQGMAGYSYQFPVCLTCHPGGSASTITSHDGLFPIFSGTHATLWAGCSDCHTDPNNRRVFSCTGAACHPQAAADPPHQGIPSYQFASAQCYSCHPTGQRGTFTQHDALFFPVYSGTHLGHWSVCADCHTDPTSRAVYTCTSSACHPQSATDPWHAGLPGYQFASAQCYSCHPTGQAGNFTQHDALYFPIYSGRHAGTWANCATCHTNPTSPAAFTCMSGSCHPQTQTNSNHGGVSGYKYVAQSCFTCHPRGTSGG